MNLRIAFPTDRRVAASRRTAGAERTRGFTLVELMVVILIIGILASIFLLALSRATQTSKVARTRSLIAKMNNMLMARWDAYRTMRLPIALEAKGGGIGAAQFDSANEGQRFRLNVARRRMFAMRELVRMEMPDRYEDLMFQPGVLVLPGTQSPARPYLWNAYRRRILAAQLGNARTRKMDFEEYMEEIAREYQSAECLYLILTTGVDDSSVGTDHFAPNDVGDKDRDGMPEFLDSWGNPIEFLRWAPGHVSMMQQMYRYHESSPEASLFHSSHPRDPEDPAYLISRWQVKVETVGDPNDNTKTVQRLVVTDQDDPFNPLRVGPQVDSTSSGTWQRSSRWRPRDPPPEHGFMLIPLIYSYGLDMKSGVHHLVGASLKTAPSQGAAPNTQLSDPYAVYTEPSSGAELYRGAPTGQGYDFDNITNQHTINR